MKVPDNKKHLLFGGTFILANKLQFMGSTLVPGLPTKQWFLLRNLIELPKEPPPTITHIAQAMDSSRQNIAKMLDVLERENIVEIEQNNLDHRSRGVRITENGRTQLVKTNENAESFLEDLYQNIDAEDLEVAGEVMIRMLKNLHEMQVRQERSHATED